MPWIVTPLGEQAVTWLHEYRGEDEVARQLASILLVELPQRLARMDRLDDNEQLGRVMDDFDLLSRFARKKKYRNSSARFAPSVALGVGESEMVKTLSLPTDSSDSDLDVSYYHYIRAACPRQTREIGRRDTE